MDKQRLKAYTELIKLLLSSPSGKAIEVLQAHMGLVDRGLVLVIGKFGDMAKKRGDQRSATVLENLAAKVVDVLGIKPQVTIAATPEEYQSFWMELGRAEMELYRFGGNSQQLVSPILQSNLRLLDLNFVEAVRSWANKE